MRRSNQHVSTSWVIFEEGEAGFMAWRAGSILDAMSQDLYMYIYIYINICSLMSRYQPNRI